MANPKALTQLNTGMDMLKNAWSEQPKLKLYLSRLGFDLKRSFEHLGFKARHFVWVSFGGDK